MNTLNKDKLLELARKAANSVEENISFPGAPARVSYIFKPDRLERFAALVLSAAQAEQEPVAVVCAGCWGRGLRDIAHGRAEPCPSCAGAGIIHSLKRPLQAQEPHAVGCADAFGPDKAGCCGVTVTKRCDGCPHDKTEPSASGAVDSQHLIKALQFYADGLQDDGNVARVALWAVNAGAVDSPFPERDPSKPAEQQGMFQKFYVQRVDGSDQAGGKHYGCRYFVLDLNHDQHAPAAMRAYAAACKATHLQLATDIEAEFGAVDSQPSPVTDELPPLPDPFVINSATPAWAWNAYTADQMREYPRLALSRAQTVPDADRITTLECENAVMRETLQGIADADWRKWEELASADEFVRWAKSRANHALAQAGKEPTA